MAVVPEEDLIERHARSKLPRAPLVAAQMYWSMSTVESGFERYVTGLYALMSQTRLE